MKNRATITTLLLLLGTVACGPGVSGSCPTPTAGNAAELAQKESAPSEAEEPSKVVRQKATEPAAPAADGGAGKPSEPGQPPKAGEAAAPAAAGGGELNITGAILSGGKPVKFAVAYLEDGPKDPKRGTKVSIDQRMMMFMPYTAVVAVGGSAIFVNSDPFPHNVFSPSNEKFDLGTIPKGGAGRYVFKKPGAYTLLCNVHPGMIGYVYVAPSSYFATANVKGQFTIKKVPEGSYKIAAWAPKMSAQPKTVTVKGADASIDLELEKK